MNHSLLQGGPARGHQDSRSTQDVRSSHDARSNYAVQPAANVGSFKLKKKAVKIVGAAGPAPSAPRSQAPPATTASMPSRAASNFPTLGSSSAPGLGLQQAAAKENEPPRLPQLAVKPSPPISVATLPPSNIELPSRSIAATGSLDDMFARLSGVTPSMPLRLAKELSPTGPDKSFFASDDRANTVAAVVQTKTELPRRETAPTQALSEVKPESTASWQGESQDEREAVYLRKAATYLDTLPTRPGDIAHIIKAVANKLRTAYAQNVTELQPEEVEKLRARIVFAVMSVVNKKIKLTSEPLVTDFVKKILRERKGDFFQLCAALVESGYIALSDFKHVTVLCQTILDVLPKTDSGSAAGMTSLKAPSFDDSTKPAASTTRPGQIPAESAIKEKLRLQEKTDRKTRYDPLEDTKAWPTQEKREHGAIYRACVLKGVGGVKSLNQLQALVWGGRLESIQLPEPGSEHALVKFLTPEACQTYLDATENGIEVQGAEKKAIIFVDKQPGPNSINDVIQNCIEGDASRCVRATGADDDWAAGALFKLARGKQSIPRDVDCIKQGKTAREHHYIEFRFGNIYHALNFKRYLMDDDEWKHCSIGYAEDPCQLASGVHYKDADEEGGGFLA
ncbi:uncharacterized protein M421DRAFT_423502 [Didymella exigua CBS 183.55]|uniref:Uncharacterized protein n=1 Tax=Didymella exigua CBS 183.55 TaxID=1150837 RepID=A0A6A5RDY9_9PLEO|nr:uncharacterized protein M421DRAFT_423502 [Didymella exigua CBS 183.55]KAF1925673.1 hypothetical protein M421DRAFT_423502 [Didymella exigua CBS 183.55]